MRAITQVGFVDLYLGEGFSDVTGLAGAARREPVPAELAADVRLLREECERRYNAQREDEFSLNVEGTIFRVTAMGDVLGKNVYILRRSTAAVRPLGSLGLAAPLMHKLLAKDLHGLILIAGEMAAGKTSTAATLVVERLKRHGGMAIALEDPVETPLNGEHGPGRCIQVPVTRRRGGYKERMPLAMRSGASLILIGEIRDDETAVEVLRASINGHLVISTIHAGSIAQAIERLQTLCIAKMPNADSILADGLAMVVWQQLTKAPAGPSGEAAGKTVTRLKAECLDVKDQPGVQAKIRAGKAASLNEDIHQQAQRLAWMSQEARQGAQPR